MPYVSPASPVSGAVISKTAFGDVVKADLDFLANPPSCRLTHSTTQTLTSGVEMTPTFDTELHDTDSMHSTVTNPTRITINTDGVYIVTWGLITAAGDTDWTVFYSYCRRNGSTSVGTGSMIGTMTNGSFGLHSGGSTSMKLTAGDYLELRANQVNSSAGAHAISSAGLHFAATWIGRGV